MQKKKPQNQQIKTKTHPPPPKTIKKTTRNTYRYRSKINSDINIVIVQNLIGASLTAIKMK